MANTSTDTGHGATVAFTQATQFDNVDFSSIDLGEESIPDVDTTHLGTTNFRTYIPGDLREPGEVTLTFNFDNDDQGTSADQVPPAMGSTDEITITFPVNSVAGQSTGAKLVGNGYFKSYRRPTLETDTLQTGQVVFKFDGGVSGTTEPTFTGAS